jgi:hypothetical protein
MQWIVRYETATGAVIERARFALCALVLQRVASASRTVVVPSPELDAAYGHFMLTVSSSPARDVVRASSPESCATKLLFTIPVPDRDCRIPSLDSSMVAEAAARTPRPHMKMRAARMVLPTT